MFKYIQASFPALELYSIVETRVQKRVGNETSNLEPESGLRRALSKLMPVAPIKELKKSLKFWHRK